MIPIECFAHILHRTGENCGDDRDLVKAIREKNVDYFKNSHKRISSWRDFSDQAIPSHNRIRWGSDNLLEAYIEKNFDKFVEFLKEGI